MTNPGDPRTPQERAYDPAEWAPAADDATRQTGPAAAADQPTEQYYTADPYQAYGSPPPNATQAYPTYDPRLDPQAPPSGRTQAYPTYYAQGGYPPAGPPPTGEVPPLAPPPKRKVGVWVAVGAGVVLLGLGLIGGLLLAGGGSGDTPPVAAPAAPTTTRPVTPPTGSLSPRQTPSPTTTSPLDNLPGGIGDLIGQAGSAMGTITANSGGTLTLDGLGGTTITVRTTSDTTLISLTARTVADLKPGESVVVQGDRVENGTLTAKLIIGTSIPGLGN